MSDLKERVVKFSMMELPGQPTMMHMGTSYLVNDLWSEVKQLRAEVEELKVKLGQPNYNIKDAVEYADSHKLPLDQR